MNFKILTSHSAHGIKSEIDGFIARIEKGRIVDIKVTANRWDWVAVIFFN